MTISGLNHAVLYVRDADAAARWYGDALGFELVTSFPGAAFLRTSGSANHHDLGLFSVGAAELERWGAGGQKTGSSHHG